LKKRPSIRTTAALLLVAGFALGLSTLSSGQSPTPSSAGVSAELPLPALDVEAPGPAPDVQFPVDDPSTKVHEPFMECSAEYAEGAGGDLDKKSMIGPENNVMVTPEEMKALGMPETAIRSQKTAWQNLSLEEREEQLCRAAQQGSVLKK
jgi:hypothetical protein